MSTTTEQPLAIQLDLVSTGSADVTTVWIRCPVGMPWHQVREACRRAGVPAQEHTYVGPDAITDDLVLGEPPLVYGAVLTDRAAPGPPQRLLELVVIEGPDTGAHCSISPDAVVVGRDRDSALHLSDEEASRRHCVITQDQGHIVLTDCGSTNGTEVSGERVAPHASTTLRVGSRVRLGSSTLVVRRAPGAPANPEHDGRGHLVVRRAPRRSYPMTPQTVASPTPPRDPPGRSIPWAMIGLPLVMALVMMLIFHSTMFLMFALLSPAMILGQHLSERRSRTHGRHHERREYERRCEQFATALEDTLQRELAGLRRSSPSLVDLEQAARTLGEPLWQREPHHPDHLVWRVGTGPVDSETTVRTADGQEHRTLHDAPVTLSLASHHVTGVCGDPAVTTPVLAGLLVQVAALHSPLYLRVIILCESAQRAHRWRWAHRLPHLSSGGAARVVVVEPDSEALSQVTDQLAPQSDSLRTHDDPVIPHTLLLLDSAVCATRVPAIAEMVADAAARGVAVVAISDRRDDLPSACDVVVEAPDQSSIQISGRHSATGQPDIPTPDLVSRTVRRLAHLVDATPRAGDEALPDRLDLLPWQRSQSGLDLSDAGDLAAHWRRQARSTEALLGARGDGALVVDLAADGPHALVAGTTGAGKSELLQTMIVSLAAANRPDQMVFVLIDYKGGAAFKDCARLPHTVGLVTDLDGHLTTRALTSLEAELRRRERMLADAGAKDITDYQALSDVPPMPRLMLVIDEFRVLAEELPDFITGLVRIATVGRSLGIHLVLATQRPAGVVSPEIRANVNLRIALRVRDDADSQDVIGSTRAARISSAHPGRAVLRTGGAEQVEFQTARAGGISARSGDGAVQVAAADPLTSSPLWPPEEAAEQGSTDLQRIVEAVITAAQDLHIPAQPSPWLPALPEVLDVADLCQDIRTLSDAEAPAGAPTWPLATLDLPSSQCVATASWCPAVDGQLCVIGGPRSGRTTTARTLATQACTSSSPDDLHLYVLDAGGGLFDLERLPHCGAVIGRDDVSRLLRLTEWLSDLIRRRQADLAATSTTEPPPRILLVIDAWDTFGEVSEEATAGRLMDDLAQIVRDGAAVGICAVATGGRALTSGRVSALFSSRIALSMPDETDLLMLGVRAAQVPSRMPPGRGLLLPDATELQVALLGGQTSIKAQRMHIDHVAAGGGLIHRPPRAFRSLPARVNLGDLSVRRDVLPLGVTGDELTTDGLPLPARGGLAALIAGPPRSGRTTALVTIAHAIDPGRPVAYVGHSPCADLPPIATAHDPDDPSAISQWCREHPSGALLVDDIDQLAGTPTEEALLQHLAGLRSGGGILVAAGAASSLSGIFRGLVPELRRAQTGLLLQPGRHDGDLLGVRVDPMDRPRPGHGLLVIRGQATEIQLAHPGDA